MDMLYANQTEIGEQIGKILINYKKEGRERKTIDSCQRKLDLLDSYWREYDNNHQKLLSFEKTNHKYFVNSEFERIKDTYLAAKKTINEGYDELLLRGKQPGVSQQREIPQPEAGPSSDESPPRTRASATPAVQARGTNSKLDDMLRKQSVNFKAFVRTVDSIDIESFRDKWEFEDALRVLQTRWTVADNLHWEIISEIEEDEAYEFNFSKHERTYNTIRKEINSKMWSTSYREKTTPQMDIPVFTGTFHQWVSFKDLFNEAIHNNPSMSNAQKMQFLKSKVKGEAERLIQHLPISTDNYKICWEILNHRFDNKKQIFTSHVSTFFNLPNIQQQSFTAIKRLHDVTLESLYAIKNLGVDISTWDPLLVYILSQKLDSESYSEYIESLKNSRELPVLQDLLNFLENKFTTLESSRRRQDVTSKPQQQNQSTSFHQNRKNHLNSNSDWKISTKYEMTKPMHVSAASANSCPHCFGAHSLIYCKRFLELSNEVKLKIVKQLNFCVNCIYDHNGIKCYSTKRCHKCSENHHTILHDYFAAQHNKSNEVLQYRNNNNREQNVSTESGVGVFAASQQNGSEILLETALVKVTAADGTQHVMRALIDQGSQVSVISERAAQQLGLKRDQCRGVIFGVGEQENKCKGKLNITCQSTYTDYKFTVDVLIMNNVIKNLPNKTFSKPSWPHIAHIFLADPDYNISRPVDLLLGADVYSIIILEGLIRGQVQSEPLAQHTRLGWLLCGSVKTSYQCNVILNNIEDIQQVGKVEDFSEQTELSVLLDQDCLEFYKATTRRLENGRYGVRSPMKQQTEEKAESSKQIAIAKFKNLEHKFIKQDYLAKQYKQFISEYEELKHIKSTPFLALITLRQLEEDEHQNYFSAAKSIREQFYMDDWVAGSHSIQERKRNIEEVKAYQREQSSGGFTLRKGSSNNKILLEYVKQSESKQQALFTVEAENSAKTSGLQWNSTEYEFTFQSDLTSSDRKEEWILLKQDQKSISQFKSPRWLQSKQGDVIERHGFGDASSKAFACVVYARIPANDVTSVGLVAAKTRLVPNNKVVSLPRLELCAAELLSKLKIKIIISGFSIDDLLNRYSSFVKITRIVAWIRRALTPINKQRPTYLTLHELKLIKIKNVQRNNCSEEIDSLLHNNINNKLKSNSKLLSINAFISADMKYPIFIPYISRLTDLLIEKARELTFHGGARLTLLASAAQSYWRTIVKLLTVPIEQKKRNEEEEQEKRNEEEEKKSNEATAKSSKQLGSIKCAKFVNVALSLLFFMSIIWSSEASYNSTQFSRNQSLYFDPVGRMHLIRDQWKIVAYYDMQPYWQGDTAVNAFTKYLEQTCEKVKEPSHCHMILLQIQHDYSELQYYNQLLLHQNYDARSRTRRGLINAVGSVANTLFGVLDESFAEKYQRDIELVNLNQKHLTQLWRNQTSIVEAEYNILKRTEQAIETQHKLINKHLNYLDQTTKQLQKEYEGVSILQEFTLAAMATTNMVQNLKRIQDTLIDTVTDIYHGKINLHLLTPKQLSEELQIVSGQISKELILPIDSINSNLYQIYKLMKIKARMSKEYFIFEMTLPLISRDSFQLYHLIPVPLQIGSSMISIKPITEYVAINLRRDSYLTANTNDLQNCEYQEETYICHLQGPINHLDSEEKFCETNQKDTCDLSKLSCKNRWVQLHDPSVYFYFICDSYSLTIICDEEIRSDRVSKAGLIQLSKQCIAKGRDLTLYSYQQQNTLTLNPSILSTKIAPLRHPLVNNTLPHFETNEDNALLNISLKHLDKQITAMKEAAQQDVTLTTHDVHQYAISYGLLAAAIVAFLWFLWRRGRRAVSSPAPAQPREAPASSSASVSVSARNLPGCEPELSVSAREQPLPEQRDSVHMTKRWSSLRTKKDNSTSPIISKKESIFTIVRD